MTALTSTTSPFFPTGSMETNMVQEVHGGYDAYSAMLRQNAPYGNMHHLTGYNATFSASSGQHAAQSHMAQYAAAGGDYAAYGTSQPGPADPTSWAMYPTSVSPSTSSSTRQPSTSSVLLGDHDWSPQGHHHVHQQQHQQQQQQQHYVGNVTVQPHHDAAQSMAHLHHVTPAAGSTTPTGQNHSAYSSYRGSGCLPTMPTDYGAPSSSTSTSGLTPTLTPSPTPGAMGVMAGSPPGGGVNANRQTNRPPYDWMKKASYPSTPTNGKTRTKDKYRVVYTDHQRLELEKEFHYSRYITIRRKAELAQSLGLSERQVKIWFQNRRAKERKQNKKREESLGIKTERPDPSLPLLSPLGGVLEQGVLSPHCSGGVEMPLHHGAGGTAQPGMAAVGGSDMVGLHTHSHQQGTSLPPSHTPPMSAHSPPLSAHHS